MKRVLVTGGAGFLGHHFVEHILKNTDWEVVVLDSLNYSTGGFDKLRDIKVFDDKRVTVLTADLKWHLSAGIWHEIGEINYIVHLAAETHVDNSIKNPGAFIESNVLGTFHILEYAKHKDIDLFVYFSTDEVYGPAAVENREFTDNIVRRDYSDVLIDFYEYREWDRYNCTNPYSATKAAGEELTLAWGNTYGVPVVITHCMNLFGERQHVEKFIPNTIRKVLHGDSVTVHSYPDRTHAGSRIYLHARSASDAVLFLLDNPNTRTRDKYNITGQREIDNLSLAKLIAAELGYPLKYEMVDFHSSRPGHDLRYALSGRKLKDLGWEHPTSFEESLRRTIQWFVAHPEWLEYSKHKEKYRMYDTRGNQDSHTSSD